MTQYSVLFNYETPRHSGLSTFVVEATSQIAALEAASRRARDLPGGEIRVVGIARLTTDPIIYEEVGPFGNYEGALIQYPKTMFLNAVESVEVPENAVVEAEVTFYAASQPCVTFDKECTTISFRAPSVQAANDLISDYCRDAALLISDYHRDAAL